MKFDIVSIIFTITLLFLRNLFLICANLNEEHLTYVFEIISVQGALEEFHEWIKVLVCKPERI